MKEKKPKYYIEPENFHTEYNNSIIEDKPTYKLILMFEKIAMKYSKVWKDNKLDRDCCINYATSEACRKWKKYNKDRSDNIFSFFTQMIKNDMMTHHNKIVGKENTISIESLFTNKRDL